MSVYGGVINYGYSYVLKKMKDKDYDELNASRINSQGGLG